MVMIYTVNIICTVRTVYTFCCGFIIKYTVCCKFVAKGAVYCKFVVKGAVCCKLIVKGAVCRNLLANAVNLLQNARFVRIAMDYIRPPRSYGFAAICRKPQQPALKKIPDVMEFFY
jgi:hypothetical protein